jgi:putative transposase
MAGRRSIRLKGYDYSQAGAYFLTIITLGRECLFGDVAGGVMGIYTLARIVQECWQEIPAYFPHVNTDVFGVMPNHFHGIFMNLIKPLVGA